MGVGVDGTVQFRAWWLHSKDVFYCCSQLFDNVDVLMRANENKSSDALFLEIQWGRGQLLR